MESHHGSLENIPIVLAYWKKMEEERRPINYVVNHGKMVDVLKAENKALRLRELEYNKNGDLKHRAEYLKGRRHGLWEAIKLLSKIWEEKS